MRDQKPKGFEVTNEQKRIIIAAFSGFVIGRSLEQYRMYKKRNEAIKKANRRESARGR